MSELALFLAIVFSLVLSALLILYIFRELIFNAVLGWFEGSVRKIEIRQGAFKDRATFYVIFQLLALSALPVILWFLFENILLIGIGLFLSIRAPGFINKWKKTRRKRLIEQELPVTLAMFASALSSGVSLNTAIATYVSQTKSPLSTEMAYVIRMQRLGVDFDDALEQVAARVNLMDFNLVVLSMRISKLVGGNLSDTLLSLSNSIQQKLVIEGKIKALTSQGVMQAWVMSMLPVLVAVALTFIQPDQMDKLYHTTAGNIVLLICAAMDYIGFKVIKKILSIDV